MPAGSTYSTIATTTLGSSASSVVFSSISGSYTDLVLVINGLSSTTSSYVSINLNSDTGSNYSRTELAGDGTSGSSGRSPNETTAYLGGITYATNTANVYNAIVNFQNYSNTTTNKTFISRINNANVGTSAVVNLWRSTTAINRIEIFATWGSGSTFTLYGIAAA